LGFKTAITLPMSLIALACVDAIAASIQADSSSSVKARGR
jgi:hypothetical protein